MTQPGQERESVAPTVAPKRKARRGRAKSPKPRAKGKGRSTTPSAKSRERASAAAAVTAKSKAAKPPKEADASGATRRRSPANGANDGQVDRAALEEILESLIAARDGDFSHRLSRRRRGILGEIASRLQRAGGRQRPYGEGARPHPARDRARGPDGPARLARAGRRQLGVEHRLDQRADRRPGAADHRGRPRDRRGGRRRPQPEDGARRSRASRSRASSSASARR